MKPRLFKPVLILALAMLGGCASHYVTPGRAANFAALGLTKKQVRAMTNSDVSAALDKKPLVTFPAALAVVHLQAANYQNFQRRFKSAANGDFRVISMRHVEKEKQLAILKRLQHLNGIAPLNALVIPPGVRRYRGLRVAAARLHANLLLCYTFDTRFKVHSNVPPLGLVTLGLFPEQNARVTSTASAVLMDVRDGYIYAIFESTRKGNQLADAWTNGAAIDQVRRRTEREAFGDLVKKFARQWPVIVARYDHKAGARRTPVAVKAATR